MKSIHRRSFIRNSALSALSISARAAAIGVPASFLTSGHVHAQAGSAKFTIIAQSSRGEAINCNAPGTFPANNNDPARLIDHASPNDLGNGTLGSIQGRNFNASDFAQDVNLQLGEQTVRAPRIWTGLPDGLLENLTGFWLQTGTNAHPEFPAVRALMGALRDDVVSNNSEELASAIAAEMAPILGTISTRPILLDGSGTFRGSPLGQYSPDRLRDLFGSGGGTIDPNQFGELYTQTIDALYGNLRQNGTRAQRVYLDQHAASRSEAISLGDSLGGLIENVEGNDFEAQLRTAVAMVQLRVTPVIAIEHAFSGDNHQDDQLSDETEETLQSLDALADYWDLIQAAGITDEVNFATLDVFGRTALRNGRGGRDHFGNMTFGLVHGTGFRGGIVGGLTEGTRRNETVPVATGINSETGGMDSPNIPAGATLAAYGKTIMRAAGIPDDRLNIRVPTGTVVTGAFN